MYNLLEKYTYTYTFVLVGFVILSTSVVTCSLMNNEQSDHIYPEALDMKQYNKNRKKIISRQLKHQETFLNKWCRPKADNSSINYVICEGFQVEQEFILSVLNHLDQVEDDVAYTLHLLPNKIYMSSNNYVLARTSDIERGEEYDAIDPNTFHVAIFKDIYSKDNEEHYKKIKELF